MKHNLGVLFLEDLYLDDQNLDDLDDLDFLMDHFLKYSQISVFSSL